MGGETVEDENSEAVSRESTTEVYVNPLHAGDNRQSSSGGGRDGRGSEAARHDSRGRTSGADDGRSLSGGGRGSSGGGHACEGASTRSDAAWRSSAASSFAAPSSRSSSDTAAPPRSGGPVVRRSTPAKPPPHALHRPSVPPRRYSVSFHWLRMTGVGMLTMGLATASHRLALEVRRCVARKNDGAPPPLEKKATVTRRAGSA